MARLSEKKVCIFTKKNKQKVYIFIQIGHEFALFFLKKRKRVSFACVYFPFGHFDILYYII